MKTAATLVVLSLATATASCGDSRCDVLARRTPTQSPTKLPANLRNIESARERSDVNNICVGLGDYVGFCDAAPGGDSCESLTWFCANERLFVLDCSQVAVDGVCEEMQDTWECVSAASSSQG